MDEKYAMLIEGFAGKNGIFYGIFNQLEQSELDKPQIISTEGATVYPSLVFLSDSNNEENYNKFKKQYSSTPSFVFPFFLNPVFRQKSPFEIFADRVKGKEESLFSHTNNLTHSPSNKNIATSNNTQLLTSTYNMNNDTTNVIEIKNVEQFNEEKEKFGARYPYFESVDDGIVENAYENPPSFSIIDRLPDNICTIRLVPKTPPNKLSDKFIAHHLNHTSIMLKNFKQTTDRMGYNTAMIDIDIEVSTNKILNYSNRNIETDYEYGQEIGKQVVEEIRKMTYNTQQSQH